MTARLLLVSFATALFLPAQPANEAFSRLKALAGEWKADKLTVKYEVASGGAAVVETRLPQGEPSMVTVFHLDGAGIVATHFCSVGIHPRMRASAAVKKDTLDFLFVDAANMKNPGDGHIHGLKVRFVSANEFEQTWTWRMNGKDEVATVALKRR